jgi:hypothetical protein
MGGPSQAARHMSSASVVRSLSSVVRNGAGEGNRTPVVSLEGCCSTIELHPQASGVVWWRGLDSNQRRLSQRIYSPSPLTTRAPLRIDPRVAEEDGARKGPADVQGFPWAVFMGSRPRAVNRKKPNFRPSLRGERVTCRVWTGQIAKAEPL